MDTAAKLIKMRLMKNERVIWAARRQNVSAQGHTIVCLDKNKSWVISGSHRGL
jgi:hypothetical protein